MVKMPNWSKNVTDTSEAGLNAKKPFKDMKLKPGKDFTFKVKDTTVEVTLINNYKGKLIFNK